VNTPETALVLSGSGLPPAIAKALGDNLDTRILEPTLARVGIFAPKRGAQMSLGLDMPEEWRQVGSLYRAAVQVRGAETLTVRDHALMTEVGTHWLRDGAPDDRLVTTSLPTAIEWMAYQQDQSNNYTTYGWGGWPRRRLVEAGERLKAVSIKSLLMPVTTIKVWGLINEFEMDSGSVQIEVNRTLADLLRAKPFALAHGPTMRQLVNLDPIAARLWAFLECETTDKGGRLPPYPLFGGEKETWVPAIADLLMLRNGHRSQVASRLRKACAVIRDVDPRYSFEVTRRRVGEWDLLAVRNRRRSEVPSSTKSGTNNDRTRYGHLQNEHTIRTTRSLPNESPSSTDEKPHVALLRNHWGKPPSKKQLDLIEKVRGTAPNNWLADRFREAIRLGRDPLEYLLSADCPTYVRPVRPIIWEAAA
jgi:hypothetical protein